MVEVATGNIAKDFKIGNTRVRISTDFCEAKTPEEVQKILERIAKTAKQHFVAAKTVEKNAESTEIT